MIVNNIQNLITICEQKSKRDNNVEEDFRKIALRTITYGGLSAAGTALAAKFGAFGPAGENYMNTLPAHMWDTAKSTVRGASDAFNSARSRHFEELVKLNQPKTYTT